MVCHCHDIQMLQCKSEADWRRMVARFETWLNPSAANQQKSGWWKVGSVNGGMPDWKMVMLSSIHLMRICTGNSTDSYFGLITYRFMSEGTVQIADQMHGWIDGSAVQPGCGGSMTARRSLANTPCFSRSRGVLKNEDLKPLDSCDMLEFNFTLKGASDVFEMRFDHEGQDIKRWFKDRKLEKVLSPQMKKHE